MDMDCGIGHPWGALGCSIEGLGAGSASSEKFKVQRRFCDKETSTGSQYQFQAENDEALWLVGGGTLRCLVVWDVERMQVEELLRDMVGLV